MLYQILQLPENLETTRFFRVLRYLCPDRSELDNDDCTLRAVVEIIKMLKEEGIVNMELTRQYANSQTPSLRTKPYLPPPIPLQQVEKRRADFA